MVMKAALSIHFLVIEVLFLQFFKSLQLRCIHATVFALPVVKCCLVYTILPAKVGYFPASFLFSENLDDLALGKSCLFHASPNVVFLSIFRLLTVADPGEAYNIISNYNRLLT